MDLLDEKSEKIDLLPKGRARLQLKDNSKKITRASLCAFEYVWYVDISRLSIWTYLCAAWVKVQQIK